MRKKKKTYRRLPGNVWTRRGGFLRVGFNNYSLWMAADHLLYVKSTSFSEDYRRFYWKDIQAIVVSRTATRRNWNIVLGSICLLCAALSFSALVYWPPAVSDGFVFLMEVVGAIFAFYLLLNTLLGPTCRCRLHTDVQVEELDCLGRIRTARKLVSIIRPFIEAAQGKVSPALETEANESVLQASAHAIIETPPVPKKNEVRHVDTRVHTALFGLLLVGAISSIIELLYQGQPKNLIDMILFLAILLLIIFALRRQGNSTLPSGLKGVTWIALGFMILNFMFGVSFGMIYAVIHASEIKPFTPIKFKGPVFEGYCITAAVFQSLLALVGLIMLYRYQKESAGSTAFAAGENVQEKEA
jgi:hypothetical protein